MLSFAIVCLRIGTQESSMKKMGGKVIGEDMDNEESWMNSVIYRFTV